MENQNLSAKVEEGIQYTKAAEHLISESGQSLEKLLKENLKYSEAIARDIKKIKRHLMWTTVFNWIWVAIIVVPIVIALIFLPTILNGLSAITGGGQGMEDLLNLLK